MVICFSILAWTIPWTEEPGGILPRGRKELDITETEHARQVVTVWKGQAALGIHNQAMQTRVGYR